VIDIIVIRNDGDRPGDDVVDGLIGSLPVALARGQAELDERGQRMKDQTIEGVHRDGVRLGQLLRVNDAVHGSFASKSTGIAHRAQGGRVTSTLQVRRPA